jgi:hypothetical protein
VSIVSRITRNLFNLVIDSRPSLFVNQAYLESLSRTVALLKHSIPKIVSFPVASLGTAALVRRQGWAREIPKWQNNFSTSQIRSSDRVRDMKLRTILELCSRKYKIELKLASYI